MSPPIYTPDGTEVSEIVLPDGSTASQVIGPDGNVVFEAEPDIPDSGIVYDFNAASVSANDGNDVTTWTDTEASIEVSGSATYRSSTSSLGDNPTLEFDGSSDGFTQSDTSINTNVSTPLSIHCVIDPVDTGGTPRIVDSDSSSDSYFQLLYDSSIDTHDLQTNNGNLNRLGSPTNNPQVLTGVMGGSSGVEIRRDDTTLGSDTNDGGGYDGTIAIGFAPGFNGEYFKGIVARIIWNDTSVVSASDLDQALISKYGI